MALDNLTIILDGEVPLEEFSRTIQRFYKLVKVLSQEVGNPDLDWIIDDLQVGSAVATARSLTDPEAAERVVSAYADIGTAMESNTAPLADYSIRVKNAAVRVVSIRDRRVSAVRFETPIREATVRVTPGKVIPFPTSQSPLRLTGMEAEHTRPLMIAPAPSFGAIQGRVQALTNRGAMRFTIYDLLYDKAVGCYVSKEQQELLRDIWGKMAVIEGMITRDPISGRPLTVRQVSNITPMPEPWSQREYQDAMGSAPSLSGLLPEEAIRRIRDAR